jgi:hypothetical protein
MPARTGDTHAAMSDGIFALLGVALGWLGNAALERWRRSGVRTDARTDRQAATLREAQVAIGDFMLAWSPLTWATAQGNPPNLLDAAVSGGPPGISHRRLPMIAERVHVEPIRDKMHKLATDEMALARALPDDPQEYVAVADLQDELITGIGAELRKLEAR